MKPALLLEIVAALMRARWKQTLVAAVGVTFSITMFVTLLGFMNGLNGLLDSLITNRTAHVRLYNEPGISAVQPIEQVWHERAPTKHFIHSPTPKLSKKEIHNAKAILKQLHTLPDVKGVAPRALAQVFFHRGNIELTGQIIGVQVDEEIKLFSFVEYITEGDPYGLVHYPNSIILGKGMADKLLVKVGDYVQATTPQGTQIMLRVVGLFQSGMAEIDKVQSYASLATVQKVLGKPTDYMTELLVKLHDINQAPLYAAQFRHQFGTQAEDIQSANAQFETGTKVRNLISYAVGITLLVVAGFGIFNILNMMIYEKMDTIAILKATGFSGADVKTIFITISLSLGVAGATSGLLFGYFMCVFIDNIPFVTAALPTIKTYPIDYNPKYYITAGVFALITTFLAGYFPARKAGKVDPVAIIRGK